MKRALIRGWNSEHLSLMSSAARMAAFIIEKCWEACCTTTIAGLPDFLSRLD
jgi:hypothetical protein